MANRIDLSNILINFLKKARYERHIKEGTLEENQFYAVTDGNEKTEYGDLFGNIENQADLYNALYASRLFKMEMCNDVRGYDIVHKLYDRREFDLSKFTVIGNPTIENGILKEVGGANRIQIDDVNPSTNDFYAEIKYICNNITPVGNSEYIYWIRGGFSNICHLEWYCGNSNLTFRYGSTGLNKRIVREQGEYFIQCYKNNEKVGFNVYKDGEFLTSEERNTDLATDTCTKGALSIGTNNIGGGALQNNYIDLKYLKVDIAGINIANGLKDLTQYDTYTLPSSEVITIPYIPSVDGVKIVDVAYKPLVDQLYTETGMGNYIIIDETNKTFRLPLPDIYSQIEKKTSFTLRKWED